MEAMRKACIQARATDPPSPHSKKFRQQLAKVFPAIGSQQGTLLVNCPPGVMTIYGEGHGYVTEVGGPFNAFLFSGGNLMPGIHQDSFLPLWIPNDIRLHDWTQFRFLPFVIAAHHFARHTLVNTGIIEEELKGLTEAFEHATTLPERRRTKKWRSLRDQLLRLHGRAAALDYCLHMSQQRSQSTLEQSVASELKKREDVFLLRGWSHFDEAIPQSWVTQSLASKRQLESEGHALLAAHSERISRVLDAMGSDFQFHAARSMRFWAMLGAVAGIAALAIASASLWVAH
jgi:hypothetical protein